MVIRGFNPNVLMNPIIFHCGGQAHIFRQRLLLLLCCRAIFLSFFSKCAHTSSGNARFKSYASKREARFAGFAKIPYILQGDFLHLKIERFLYLVSGKWSNRPKNWHEPSLGYLGKNIRKHILKIFIFRDFSHL